MIPEHYEATKQNGCFQDNASAGAPGAPGGVSIADLHKRLTSGFDRTTPTNGGMPTLKSEQESISTPVAPLQGGRHKDLSDIEDSNCIQSELLQRGTELATPSAAGGLNVGVHAAGAAEADNDNNSKSAADSHVPTQLASGADAAQAQQTAVNGSSHHDTSAAADAGTAPSRDGGAFVQKETSRVSAGPKAGNSQRSAAHFLMIPPGAQTISWEENAGRHVVKEGSIDRREQATPSEAIAIHVRPNRFACDACRAMIPSLFNCFLLKGGVVVLVEFEE